MEKKAQKEARKKPTWAEIMAGYSKAKKQWRLAGLPVIGPLISRGKFGNKVDANWMVPVNVKIGPAESVALPFDILRPILEKASYIFRMNRCPCRAGYGCQNFPHEIGCIMMGPGARDIRPEFGQEVTLEEALQHARRAVEAGLVPLIVHAKSDADLFGIDYRRMLAICLCCDCCCDIRMGLRLGPQAFWSSVHRLPGLLVSVSDECNLCGKCVEVCFKEGVISLGETKAQINEQCVGCGKCATVCPLAAISFQFTMAGEASRELVAVLEGRTEI